MKNASAHLAIIGGITLIALASWSPALAGAKRQNPDSHWRQSAPELVVKDGVRRRSSGEEGRHIRRERRYFGIEPGRGFGVGPDSYECYGYDCNW